MRAAKWYLAILLALPFTSFQGTQAGRIKRSYGFERSINNRTIAGLKRARREEPSVSTTVTFITGDSAAADKVCTNIVPCSAGSSEEQEQLYRESMNNCIYYNPYDVDNRNLEDSTEEIEKKAKQCYNTDPDPKSPTEPGQVQKAAVLTDKTPKNLNDGYNEVGFAIPPKSVYRFSKFLDLYAVADKYKDDDGLIAFEFMDWPGQKLEEELDQQMGAQKVLDVNKELGAVKECMQVLEFEGRSDKFVDYLCNADEGLDITALGMIGRESLSDQPMEGGGCSEEKLGVKSITEDENGNLIESVEPYNKLYNLRCNLPKNRNDEKESKCAYWPVPPGKMYLASGNMSLLSGYVQPLVVGEDILRKLVQPNNLSLDGEAYVPKFDSQVIQCTELFSKDIRTVLDFAFSSDRLILGMKCGVILVKNINQEELVFDVAYMKISDRQTPTVSQAKSHMFPYMINTIAASTCCSTDKMCKLYKPIVAIYSSYAAYKSYPEDDIFSQMPKFIYISTDNGDTFDRRVVASPNAEINLMYWMYAKIPKWQIKDARPPNWVKTQVFVGDPGLGQDFEEPVNPITNYLMQNVIPQMPDEECFEIVSMVVVSEENLLLVLCRYKQDGPRIVGRPNTYGIFTIQIRGTLPLITTIRRSKRKIKCTPVQLERYWAEKLPGTYSIEPSLVRVPNSYSIFITGCDKVLYYSSNGGKTMFISSFFIQQINGNNEEYIRTHINEYFTHVPMIALDSQGQTVMMTYGTRFAYGVISSNTEISFVSGPVLDHLTKADEDKWKPVFIPFLNDAGKVGAAVIYIDVLERDKQFFSDTFVNRTAIRLLDCSVSIHKASLPYYTERLSLKSKTSRDSITPCKTFNFKFNKTTMFLDVGESEALKISVADKRKNTPLSILLTHDKAASLHVSKATAENQNKEDMMLLQHAWEVEVKAKAYTIPRKVAKVNAFFGASYSNLEEVSAHLIISTEPQMRCHIQPRGHLQVRFGCNKRLVIHEDERRPHCEKFQQDFQYSIPQGHYDEDMANYWILERPKFYKIVNGTLMITYDYEMFGCPVQPYRLEDYFPDLRILPIDGTSNTTVGQLFNGSFVLVEIFGASGYSFKQRVKGRGCKNNPQTLERMIEEWKVRVEAIKSIWYDYPHFDFEAVYHPLNIWNRVNYEACQDWRGEEEEPSEHEGEEGDEDGEVEEEEEPPDVADMDVLESPYEILKRASDPESDEQNKLVWDPVIRQQVYIFLAVAVDPYGTFCNYHTFFGLSITVPKEEEDWVVILVFFISLLVLILLIIAGYYFRRYQIYRRFYKEAMFNHLLTAAWNLSFRYEKMLYDAKVTDPEVRKEMEETRQMKNTHSGVESPVKKQSFKGVEGLRHRLRQ